MFDCEILVKWVGIWSSDSLLDDISIKFVTGMTKLQRVHNMRDKTMTPISTKTGQARTFAHFTLHNIVSFEVSLSFMF